MSRVKAADNISVAQAIFIRKYKLRKIFVNVMRIAILIAFALLWEISVKMEWINGFIFSSPSRMYELAMKMIEDNSLLQHIKITLMETMLSFFLITFIGLIIAVLLWLSKLLTNVFEPYLVVLNSLPKTALAPIMIVWFGATMKAIIITAVSVAVFGTIISIYSSMTRVNEDKIKLIYTLGGNKLHVLNKVIIPSIIPTIISTMKVNIGLALVGVIIGEFLAAKEGLGYMIIYGSQVFKLDMVMLAIIILCVLAAVLYATLAYVERRMAYSK